MADVPAGWASIGCYRLLASADTEYRSPLGRTLDEDRMSSCVLREPPRRVWLSSFQIDRYEVTRGEYQRCLDAGACERRPPSDWEYIHGGPELPAVATFDDADAFCRWRGKRLPTNAEWEKAARGTDDRIYPWGDAPPTCKQVDTGDLDRDGFSMPGTECDPGWTPRAGGRHPAGASPYGVEDLIDNAREWVSDWYAPSANLQSERVKLYINEEPDAGGVRISFSKNTKGRSAVLEYDWNSIAWVWKDRAVADPQGPPEPDGPAFHPHAIKGAWFGIPGAHDDGDTRDDTHRQYAGFRCVRSVPGPPPPSVPLMPAGELAVPYREPGYVPPGTSEKPASASAPKAGRTAKRAAGRTTVSKPKVSKP